MNLKDAAKKEKLLKNDLKYYSNQKELNLQKVGVGAVDATKEIVQGGKRTDRFINYLEYLEEKDRLPLIELDKRIAEIQKEINIITEWIQEEKRILKEYKDVELIVYCREVKGLTWEQTGIEAGYSPRQCQRKYEEYKKERNNI